MLEESNRINLLKFKIEEKFPLIHYIYLMLFGKIYNRTNNFEIQNKNNFYFYFQTWKNRKTADEFVSQTMVSVNNTVDENTVKQQAAKRKILEKQLSENTARMNKIKKTNKL